jgi:hypothetical protein
VVQGVDPEFKFQYWKNIPGQNVNIMSWKTEPYDISVATFKIFSYPLAFIV